MTMFKRLLKGDYDSGYMAGYADGHQRDADAKYDAGFEAGYARGKDKAYFEVRNRVRYLDSDHSLDCGCEPCKTVRAVIEASLPRVLDAILANMREKREQE